MQSLPSSEAIMTDLANDYCIDNSQETDTENQC